MQLANTKSTNFPKAKIRFIDVSVPYPGASPSEVEEGIINKIEENLEGIDGIDRVTSTAKQNNASIAVELEENANPNNLLVEVRNAVDRVNNFPDGVEPAIIEKREPRDLTMSFAVVSDLPLQTIKDYAENIKDDLMSQKGISQVVIGGLPVEEIEVRLREEQIKAFNISMAEIRAAVANANLETFGGNLDTQNSIISIKANEKGYFARDLENIIVRADANGNVLRLGDIAEPVDQFADSPVARYYQGERTVVVEVYTLNSEDILVNAEFTKAYMDDFNDRHQGIQLKALEDGTVNLMSRLSTMIESGVAGIILVLIVLALFLDRYLATWVALKIPVAIIGMFVMVDMYGMTINVVSLFGFILVLGILVDDGVVIGENIYRHAKEKGKSPLKAALDGANEMVIPILISIATTAAAFSLFFFLPTMAGEFFGEVAFVVIAVLVVAILESFFVLPAHLAHSKGLRSDVKLSKLEKWATGSMDWIRDKLYLPVFKLSLMKGGISKVVTGLIFVVLLVGSVAMVGTGIVNFTFFPNIDDDAFFIELEMPPGTPIEVTKTRLDDISEAVEEVNQRYSADRADGQEIVRFVEEITGPLDNQGKVKVTFISGETRGISSFQLSKDIREAAPTIPEARRLIYGLGATSSLFGLPISFSLKGNDLDELRMAKEELKLGMRKNPGVSDVSDNDTNGAQEVMISLKTEAELMGLNLAYVMAQVRSGFFGAEAQSLQRKDEEVKIWVRYPEDERTSLDQLLDMQISAPNGNTFYLKDIANIREAKGNLTISHTSTKRSILVEANVANKMVSAPKVISEIESEVLPSIIEKYPSVSYEVEGQNRMSFKLIGAISTVGPIVLLFIYALIVMNCNSFSQALMVFSLFPFAFIGVITGHWVHDTPLSIFSLIGAIALIGVFINGTLVFLSTLNDDLRNGDTLKDAIWNTAKTRFRPIVLTTITTVAGLAPLIFSSSLSAQFLKGPAISIAYGLAFGVFNVLFLLPVFLHFFNRIRLAFHNTFHKERLTAEQVEPAVRKLQYMINK